MIDIVLPKNNEKEFVQMAEKLGYNGIIFLYKTEKEFCKIESDKVKIKFGIISAQGGKGKYLTFMQSGEKDAHILEHNPPNVIFGLEIKAEKDYMHQRASGLNDIMCKFAQKNKVIVAFSFGDILKSYKTKRAQVIGRIKQNTKLCRKYCVKTAIASFATDPYEMRAPKDLQTFFELIGMHPSEAKKSVDVL